MLIMHDNINLKAKKSLKIIFFFPGREIISFKLYDTVKDY